MRWRADSARRRRDARRQRRPPPSLRVPPPKGNSNADTWSRNLGRSSQCGEAPWLKCSAAGCAVLTCLRAKGRADPRQLAHAATLGVGVPGFSERQRPRRAWPPRIAGVGRCRAVGYYGHQWQDFFKECNGRDVLDFVTIAYRHLSKLRHSNLAQNWLREVQRIFAEENLHYTDRRCPLLPT